MIFILLVSYGIYGPIFSSQLMLSPAYPFGVFNCENWFLLLQVSYNYFDLELDLRKKEQEQGQL